MNVLCLSAGMLAPKKADTPTSRLHLYLNYGLLGLASLLRDAGHQPRVVHGRFDEPEDVIGRSLVDGQGRAPVLLSVPSSFALEWARRACAELRRLEPTTRIIVGGRWVVADDEDWIRAQLPDADEFIPGLAEDSIVNLVQGATRTTLLRRPDRDSSLIPPLDYSLLEDFKEFQPSIEVSRGCGMKCTFCAEADEPLSAMKDPTLVADEFQRLRVAYGSDDIHPYLEASLFRPSTEWISVFARARDERGLRQPWRAETRVDTLSPSQIHALSAAGLSVLDLGLESGSPTQLERMKKATRGDVYLKRASALLRACRDAGVWAKVNVLLHPGETPETLAETEAWLEAHRDCIKGLSVGPTILFRYGRGSLSQLAEFEAHGARVVDAGALDRDGYAHMHLGPSMPHELAETESSRIARSFMTARDYFDLKSFSYFPRSLTWAKFEALVLAAEHAQFSFRVESPRVGPGVRSAPGGMRTETESNYAGLKGG
ncbi:MAG: radical SAM protein [Deltaproteobacteria bacterium]|nr:radical SAM protein [Deltaproteobacteria bacterium]